MPSPSKARVRRASSSKSPSRRTKPIEVLRADCLASLPWLVHGFSTRDGGVSSCYGGRTLNLVRTAQDSAANVERNRELFLRALGACDAGGELWPLVQGRQIHSSIVHHVAEGDRQVPPGDGLVTAVPGVLLAVKTADCVPVLIADVERRVVGAFHAGWRGTVARIVEKGVGEMRRHFGSRARDLRAAIGPCIRLCCYQVGPEVRAEFVSQFAYGSELFEEVFDSNAVHARYPLLFLNQRAPGHGDLGPEIHLDLVEANRRQLLTAGLAAGNVCVIEGCTVCESKRFFSHRAEFGKTGRMMAVIGIRPR